MDFFRVRLNCIDHYQAPQTRYDPQLRNDVGPSQAADGPKVPVVRIFGSTETGQKVCAHIHGAFPYLYIEYPGDLTWPQAGGFIFGLHLSIDHALAVSYRRDPNGKDGKFVARITLVKGIPFYGFHVGHRLFLKIYLFNPIVISRLADLLLQGVIMKRKFQPYEAHLQYLLQFMIDYNLYGCDYLNSAKTTFRAPVPQHSQGSNSLHLWHSVSIAQEHITEDASLPRVSHCSVEVDICVQDIINRRMVKERQLHHDFVERACPVPSTDKLVFSMQGLWNDEAKRRRRKLPQSQQQDNPFPLEALITMSADSRDSVQQEWVNEKEARAEVCSLIERESASLGEMQVDFATFVRPAEFESSVQTALQSVEHLYPCNLLPALGLASGSPHDTMDHASTISVDEAKARQAFSQRDYDLVDDDMSDDVLEGVLGSRAESPRKQSVQVAGVTEPHSSDADSAETDGLWPGTESFSHDASIWNPEPIIEEPRAQATEGGVCSRMQRSNSDALLERQIDSPGHELSEASGNHEEQPLYESQDKASVFDAAMTQHSKRSQMVLESDGLEIDSKRSRRSPPLRLPNSNGDRADNKPRMRQARQYVSTGKSGDAVSAATGRHKQQVNDSQVLAQAAKDLCHWQACGPCVTLVYAVMPPSRKDDVTINQDCLADVIYQGPYYGQEEDVPEESREYAGREFQLGGNTVPFLAEFDTTGLCLICELEPWRARVGVESQEEETASGCSWASWDFEQMPPSRQAVKEWWCGVTKRREAAAGFKRKVSTALLSQIEGPTPQTKPGLKHAQGAESTSVEDEVQYMSTLSLEVHVNTRGKFLPDPEEDEIQCLFWACKSDEKAEGGLETASDMQCGMIVLSGDGRIRRQVQRHSQGEVMAESSELDLMVSMVGIVRRLDPDILTGYEVQSSSWGYLIERARVKYEVDLCKELSRIKTDWQGRIGSKRDSWGFRTTSTIGITGRHTVNIWRAMQGEAKLQQYSLENVAWQLLGQRVPHYGWATLTQWHKSGRAGDVNKVVRYWQHRARLDLEILEANEVVARTSEQARLLGVDFFSVFSRGSQFKVESIMFRIAKPENLMLPSPSRKQVGSQPALECLPLVMEPQSGLYTSPVVVLDFQSLYPSVMIAYNYCYSTCLGRIKDWRGSSRMGFGEYRRQHGLLGLLKEGGIRMAPNGVMYVRAAVRKSLLAKMLTEMLETRIMIKKSAQDEPDDARLQQRQHNRQLALKLLANVTYGYTSASFSGRMPCSEIADSIVQTGRETLERAIAYIHSQQRWGGEVVYGDTDSLFVSLRGKTREQAFAIGRDMARAISRMNPQPIKLKFEKVYHPCVLVAKKRYVGYKWEAEEQQQPEFDAKGIETVRRDGTAAEQRIEEKALRLLFDQADLSQVKAYFQRQCDKIMRGAVSVHDFCFAREVRLGSYSSKGRLPPGALVSSRRMAEDGRAEPQYRERVPYVVVRGAPGSRLGDRCVAPEELLRNAHWQLDADYYICKTLIAPLDRIFSLVGANVRQWYDDMPKVQPRGAMRGYMASRQCRVCEAALVDERQHQATCPACDMDAPASLLVLQTNLARQQRSHEQLAALCRSCSGLSPLDEVRCDSNDCPVFWSRMRVAARLETMYSA
ncbi:hypothetical protein CDD82_5281 [Ophiocordyceps australis]|uniref:DNA polymerase n=1 Tax=Ophiocordyceps australis TaxID=1399860 RepID=A0A2C5ZKX2_9HYPO|nr:hypothetical protein CDD82_5281 [Ophiocordyceps australis]